MDGFPPPVWRWPALTASVPSAIEILGEARELSNNSDLVFPSADRPDA